MLQGILHDQNFGELFVGNYNSPDSLDHLFVSIQTINSRNLTDVITPTYYDYIIVDEIHHGAAESYKALLEHFTPKVLLLPDGHPRASRRQEHSPVVWTIALQG